MDIDGSSGWEGFFHDARARDTSAHAIGWHGSDSRCLRGAMLRGLMIQWGSHRCYDVKVINLSFIDDLRQRQFGNLIFGRNFPGEKFLRFRVVVEVTSELEISFKIWDEKFKFFMFSGWAGLKMYESVSSWLMVSNISLLNDFRFIRVF